MKKNELGKKRVAKMLNYKFIIIVSLLMFSSTNWGMTLAKQRKSFLQAEKLIALKQDSQFKQVLSQLQDYPLVPYLKYSWLIQNLDRNKEISQFLADYGHTPYARLLKQKRLFYLARNKRWKQFVNNYSKNRSRKLQCYYYWAQYKMGQTKSAVDGAKKLWMSGFSQPKACDKLFVELKKTGYLTQKRFWQRFRLAMKSGNYGLARFVKKSLSGEKQKIAEFWLKVSKNPQLVEDVKNWPVKKTDQGPIFAHGIRRLIGKDYTLALNLWDKYKNNIKISKSVQQSIEKRLALTLAYRKNQNAFSRLSKINSDEQKIRAWTVRSALAIQDWQGVNKALGMLKPIEKNQERWKYWQARAFSQLGEKNKATQLYKELKNNRSYYGFLSAYNLQQQPQLQDHPIFLETRQLLDLKESAGFKAVREFRFFDRDVEAKREWWHLVKHLDKNQILAAAKVAEQHDWHNLAIFTVAKVKHWDDVNLRFPLVYSKLVSQNAKSQGIDPAIIFGLIRRESAFDKYALSPVGARGLMQIMPRTGRQIARDLKEKWSGKNILFHEQTNLKYGAFYYKQLLQRFHGHFALATAAYNAGPHRVKRWLPSDKTLPADIWIETIPFKETREYVVAVLAYATIYQQRLGGKSFQMERLMLDVKPG